MESGFLVKTEEKVVESILDFNKEIKEWLFAHGYQKTSNIGSECRYEKGVLTIQASSLVANNGVRFGIDFGVYLSSNGKCSQLVNGHFVNLSFEDSLKTYNQRVEQAYNDMKEFYNRWFNGIKEKE